MIRLSPVQFSAAARIFSNAGNFESSFDFDMRQLLSNYNLGKFSRDAASLSNTMSFSVNGSIINKIHAVDFFAPTASDTALENWLKSNTDYPIKMHASLLPPG